MNELLLYSELDEYSVTDILTNLNLIKDNQVYSMRMFSPGGDVLPSWGVAAKINELRTKGCRSIAKVDGMAASMAGVLLGFFDEREGLDVSKIMIHKAAYRTNDWDGKKIIYSQEQIDYLNSINKDLKAKLSQVINNDALKKIKGYGLDELFNEDDERIDCWLTAEEAKNINLLTKVINLDANNASIMAKAAASLENDKINKKVAATTAETKTNKKMTAEEFKAQNPEAYKELRDAIIAEIKPKDEPKAAVIAPEIVALEVEKQLKAMGIKAVDEKQLEQVAAEQAAAALKLETEAKAKKEEALANAKAELDKAMGLKNDK